jgi:ABC-2 type transport system permease protein
MSTESNAVPDSPLDPQKMAPATLSPTHPFYWSVRRELWENRSIYIAPLIVAAVTLFGFLLSMMHRHAMSDVDPMKQMEALAKPYDVAALLIMGTTFIVGLFYSLDALHGERRDRSILFWKSLPVSDLTTVLSKASIPLVVLPVITIVLTVALHLCMVLLSSAGRLATGRSVTELWSQLSLFHIWIGLTYHIVTIHVLWYAPIFCWLLLVSGWAKRATFLWAALPLAAIGIVEKVAFNSSHFAKLLGYRFGGPGGLNGSDTDPMHAMEAMDLGGFLSAPGLWIGLVFAVAFLLTAARLRRSRGPI